jgi:prepilin-type N-terminal cleavage/methylation domain-containing protein
MGLGRRTTVGRFRGAFSLAELVLVMAVVAIIAAIAQPRFANATGRYRLSAAAQRVGADLQLARSQARITSKTQTVTFDSTAGAYQMTGVNTLDNRSTNYSVTLSTDPYYATLGSITFPSNAVTFDIFGGASASGSVTVTVNGQSKTISVDAGSGKVTVN